MLRERERERERRHFRSKRENESYVQRAESVSESVVPMRHATTARGVAGDHVLPCCCYVCGRGTGGHYALLSSSHFK